MFRNKKAFNPAVVLRGSNALPQSPVGETGLLLVFPKNSNKLWIQQKGKADNHVITVTGSEFAFVEENLRVYAIDVQNEIRSTADKFLGKRLKSFEAYKVGQLNPYEIQREVMETCQNAGLDVVDSQRLAYTASSPITQLLGDSVNKYYDIPIPSESSMPTTYKADADDDADDDDDSDDDDSDDDDSDETAGIEALKAIMEGGKTAK
jgi:hypothetical protein